MTAREFLDGFTFDPATFNYDQFKARLAEEIAADDSLTTAKITELEQSNTTLGASERDLKVKLFDATMMRTGVPVAPTDSPSNGNTDPGTVPDSAIFGTPEQIRSH